MTMPRWCLTLLTVAALTACRHQGETAASDAAAEAISVRTGTVTTVDLTPQLTLPATVAAIPERSSAIAATTAARVLSLSVRVGDRVRAGQVIATLAADPNTATDLRKAEVALATARRERQRQARLLDVGVVPRSAVDLATAAEATASADVQAKSQARQLAQANATLRAPLAGLVTAVNGTVGATADLVTPLVTVADLSRVGLQAEAEAKDLSHLRAGAPVAIAPASGPSLPGTIRTLPATVDAATQRARLWIEAANPDMRLHLGQFVSVAVALPVRRALVIPAAAVVMRQAGPVVYAVAGGKAVEQAVVVRPADRPERLEVVRGLSAGTVVALDADPLSDGVSVRAGGRP